VAALVCGIASALCGLAGLLGVILGPVAIFLGISARKKIERSQGALTGDGQALAGLILGVIGLLVSLGYIALLIFNQEVRDNFLDMVNNS
jgi:hypothetical protein